MTISLPIEDDRVRFWKNESGFVFVIDELNLVAFGSDVVSAYDALMAEKARMMERAERAGLDPVFPGKDKSAEGPSALPAVARMPLWTAAVRAAVATLAVLAVIGALGVGGLWAASNAVESRGGVFKIVRGAIALAATHSRSLSEEARTELRHDLQTIIVNTSSLFGDMPPDAKSPSPE